MEQGGDRVTHDAEERLRQKLDRRDREIRILKTITTEINASLDLSSTLNGLLTHLNHYFNYRYSLILLAQADDPFLSVYASHGYARSGVGARVRIGKGIIGTVAKRKKMLNMPNISQQVAYLTPGRQTLNNPEHEITIKLPGLSNPRSQVAFPLLLQEELVGVLAVESDEFRVFNQDDENIMAAIADQAAMAIQKARLFEEKQQRLNEMRELNETLSALNRQQQKTLNLFMKYVPEAVVKKALREKPESIFDGEERNITVLFCDIRDFTTASEKLSPTDVVFLLNTYYKHMSEVIRAHEGIVNQFVGDEIFVTFGAPTAVKDSQQKSVRCALDMIACLSDLNAELRERLGVEIKVGIGINHGPVVAGNLGSADRIEYSVTGDTVNTGKRIETLTKSNPNTVLISESVYEGIGDSFETRMWEPIAVKGKEEKIKVFEVIRPQGDPGV